MLELGSMSQVMEILSHINQRVREHRNIKLPLEQLVELYKASYPQGSPLIYNFAIVWLFFTPFDSRDVSVLLTSLCRSQVYIEMGFERAPAESRLKVIPSMLDGVSRLPTAHQFTFMRCASQVLKQTMPELAFLLKLSSCCQA